MSTTTLLLTSVGIVLGVLFLVLQFLERKFKKDAVARKYSKSHENGKEEKKKEEKNKSAGARYLEW